jgi:predicted negative regulator of RcsB-dependent stress response
LATYGSDEEQVEALKRWWNDNGTSLLVGVVIVLVAFFGVRQWQASQADTSGAASDLYQQIADVALNKMTATVTEDELLAAQAVYNTLKTEHADSIYTRYAALAIARFHVEHEELDMAAAELQWILDNPKLGLLSEADEELFLTARLRLARVKLAQGMAQEALDLIQAVEPGEFLGSYAEVEGDALLELGQLDDARAAYERALANIETGNPVLLQLKLQDLGVSPVDSTAGSAVDSSVQSTAEAQ